MKIGNLAARSQLILQMIADLIFNPELRLIDGTVIRDRQDAIAFARRQQAWPVHDEGEEILHLLETAIRPEEVEAAAKRFRSWITRLGLMDR